jgi:hypothetical protein
MLDPMFRLVTTMKQGTASGLAAASARYPTVEAARLGADALFRNDRVLRVMVVRNEIPRLRGVARPLRSFGVRGAGCLVPGAWWAPESWRAI